MNLQQKVIQFTSKMKEKETQQAAEDSSVSQYDEIKDSLSEQQKDLIFTCYSKLTPLGYQKVMLFRISSNGNLIGGRRLQYL